MQPHCSQCEDGETQCAHKTPLTSGPNIALRELHLLKCEDAPLEGGGLAQSPQGHPSHCSSEHCGELQLSIEPERPKGVTLLSAKNTKLTPPAPHSPCSREKETLNVIIDVNLCVHI